MLANIKIFRDDEGRETLIIQPAFIDEETKEITVVDCHELCEYNIGLWGGTGDRINETFSYAKDAYDEMKSNKDMEPEPVVKSADNGNDLPF